MTWKQPIPTGLESIFGSDHRSNLLFRELLYRACNRDSVVTLDGKKHVSIKRGQVLYGRNIFSAYICGDPKTTDRTLEKLEKVTNLVTNQRTHDYTLVTINNYDYWVGLDQPVDQPVTNQRPTSDQPVTNQRPTSDQPVTNQRPTSDQPVTTSKSVKNVENVKMKDTPPPPKETEIKKVQPVDSEFERTFIFFKEMRQRIRKPMTPKAEELIRAELVKLAPGDERKQIAILNQSVMHSWQGVFPLKELNEFKQQPEAKKENFKYI